jgi:hypothetical protein
VSVVHRERRIEMFKARLGVPWMNTSLLIRGDAATVAAIFPAWSVEIFDEHSGPGLTVRFP